jgi:hypothetical protein
MRFSTLGGLVAAAAISVQAIPTIHSKGSKFFDSNGNQFYIKGTFALLLSNAPSCASWLASPMWSVEVLCQPSKTTCKSIVASLERLSNQLHFISSAGM